MRKPSCHGDPSVFSFASTTCTSCKNFDSCVGTTHDSLLQLKPAGAITVLLERHVRFNRYREDKEHRASVITGKRELTDEEEVTAKRLPVKVASQYRRIVSEGFIPLMVKGLAKTSNPFDTNGYKYLSVAFDQLLRGGFTKRSLRLHYMEKCGWSESTAFSAVNMVWHLFTACGVASEVNEILVPKMSVNNIDS